ncbi:helix-turn-helix domain-containing protein [Clostridium sp. Marseille-P2415]|uniref:helix-turn-helix domain-containing protein n=1 Tax=Clostridium sp. Marseille-P2415 TaxID=1805471 RepID=UPI0013566F6C|nr:helix-turn-helix transcriptional regulator [Clostridium sp. Marseille-P2415]
MNLQLISQNNTSQSELEKALGFGKGTITKWKGTTAPSADKLLKIAEYFGVTIDYLMTGRTGNDVGSPCPDCGLMYEPNDVDDVKYHERLHSSWEKAVEKYGKLYCDYAEREKIKGKNRTIRSNILLPLIERYNAELLVLKCLFSRSLQRNQFELDHVNFEGYVAMMMNNEKYRSYLDEELCQKLIDEYGTLPGIRNGESYYYPEENTADFNKLASSYTQLNSNNKKKIINYGKSLLNIQQAEEEQKHLMPDAAHQRTDLSKDELNNAARNKHDDDIMDDSNF